MDIDRNEIQNEVMQLSQILKGIMQNKVMIARGHRFGRNNQPASEECPNNNYSYKDLLSKAFAKFIRDELTSSIVYIKLASKINNVDIAKKIVRIAHEELEHYEELLVYANTHGIEIPKICIDDNMINIDILDSDAIFSTILKLEKSAVNDYKAMILISDKNQDPQTSTFFRELLDDEMKHFNNIPKSSSQETLDL